MKQRNDPFRLVVDILLLIPGILGAVFCLITAFDLPVPNALQWVCVGSLALFSMALGEQKRDKRVSLLLLALLLVLGFIYRLELVESFRSLWGVLASYYAKGYSFFRDLLPKEPTKIEAVGPAILALTVLETYLCCLSVRSWKRTTPMALSLLLCIGPCFVLTDTPPYTLPLIAVVFSVLTQAFSQSVRRREESEYFKAVGVSAVLSAVLLGIVLMLFPQKTYVPPITWTQLSDTIQKYGNRIENGGNAQAGLSGNQEDVDLSSLRALPNRPIAILFATPSEDAQLYLRGASYASFDGAHWSHGPVYERGRDGLYPYLGQEGGITLSIETVDQEELIYTTYQITQLPSGGTVFSDSYIKNNSDTTKYSMRFLQDPEPPALNVDYDKWVRTYCLSLPEQTRTGVMDWWNSQVPPALQTPAGGDPESLLNFAESLASQVSQCATYSRAPAKVPKGVDFCTWFLTQAEEGYCVHYATSCTALLRALGIPARYVSGYVCDAKANERTRVTNLQAHAWVEAWIGGRWVKIEPTPAEATEFTLIIPGQSIAQVSEPTEFRDPDETRDPRLKPDPSDSTTPTSESKPRSGIGSNGGKDEPVDLTALWVFLVIIGVPTLILVRRSLIHQLRWNHIARAKPNERVHLLYCHMLRLEKLGGGKLPEEVLFLAKKARFSQHTLTDVELEVIGQVCNEQTARLQLSNFWKRLYYKYILAVI